ncbi:MAG: acylphosphatase [Sneathiella sp.]|nr:acylphosphatase [Sneathiella sp.]
MKTVHAIISGRVQGVGYRAWAVDAAKSLSLCGWVRNRADATVEAVFQGSDEQCQQMLDKCRSGPLYANVTGIVTADQDLPVIDNFTGRSTL